MIITGGSGAGKTRVAHRLIARIAKNWRLLQLDHYVPWGWKDPAVAAAAMSLKYLGADEKHNVVFEGAVTEDHIGQLCSAMGLKSSSQEVRIVQLTRETPTAEKRRRDDLTLWAGWTEEQKTEGVRALEKQVPPPIKEAITIATDSHSEDQVFAKVVEVLRPFSPTTSKKPRDVTTKSQDS